MLLPSQHLTQPLDAPSLVSQECSSLGQGRIPPLGTLALLQPFQLFNFILFLFYVILNIKCSRKPNATFLHGFHIRASCSHPCCFFYHEVVAGWAARAFIAVKSFCVGVCGPCGSFKGRDNLIFLKNRSNNKKQILKESLKSHDNLSRVISRGKQKCLVLFALLIYTFPHSLPFLMPLWFSEKCIFLVLSMYFPLFSLPACKKKPSISQDLLTWTLAPMFWKWNLIN